jgi:hypothetical protein
MLRRFRPKKQNVPFFSSAEFVFQTVRHPCVLNKREVLHRVADRTVEYLTF